MPWLSLKMGVPSLLVLLFAKFSFLTMTLESNFSVDLFLLRPRPITSSVGKAAKLQDGGLAKALDDGLATSIKMMLSARTDTELAWSSGLISRTLLRALVSLKKPFADFGLTALLDDPLCTESWIEPKFIKLTGYLELLSNRFISDVMFKWLLMSLTKSLGFALPWLLLRALEKASNWMGSKWRSFSSLLAAKLDGSEIKC